VGLSQLKKLEGFVATRRKNWQTLHSGIKQSSLLSEHLTPVSPTEGTNPSWFGFPMYCSDQLNRDQLVRRLEEKKVGTRLVFGGNLTKQPAYLGADYRISGDLRATDEIMKKAFWIGVHPGLGSSHLQYILEVLEDLVHELVS
jgi:CDP-6-deoxy-D-xylo-4-hexulose-3-dehydrase